MKELQSHPVAEIIPAMDPVQFAALKADIQANGVKVPIWICDGKILDGRNRYRACRELGIECPQVEVKKENRNPLADAASLNLNRRHMTPSQRSLVAASIATYKHPGGDRGSNQHGKRQSANLRSGTSHAEAAAAMGVSERSVDDAAKVLDEGSPTLIAAVTSGAMKVSTAAAALGKSKKGKREKGKKRTKPPKLDDLTKRALWLWQYVNQFMTNGIIDCKPSQLIHKLEDHMRKDLRAQVPQLIAWLQSFARREKQ